MKRLLMLVIVVISASLLVGFTDQDEQKQERRTDLVKKLPGGTEMDFTTYNKKLLPLGAPNGMIKQAVEFERMQRVGTVPMALQTHPQAKYADESLEGDGGAQRPVQLPVDKALGVMFPGGIHNPDKVNKQNDQQSRSTTPDKDVMSQGLKSPGALRIPQQTPNKLRNPAADPVQDGFYGELEGDDDGGSSCAGPMCTQGVGFGNGDKTPADMARPDVNPVNYMGELTGDDGGNPNDPVKNMGNLRNQPLTPVDMLKHEVRTFEGDEL